MSLLSTDIVLVVEPDLVTRETYRRALSGAGFRVNLVDDGGAAVSFLEQYRPAAVVFDPGVPQLNGATRSSSPILSTPLSASP